MTLTPKQRRQLRALAHQLKPVVLMGSKGLTDEVNASIDEALLQHELIKIKMAGAERDERKGLADSIATANDAAVVQIIGSTLILYRRHPKNPVIVLEKK